MDCLQALPRACFSCEIKWTWATIDQAHGPNASADDGGSTDTRYEEYGFVSIYYL